MKERITRKDIDQKILEITSIIKSCTKYRKELFTTIPKLLGAEYLNIFNCKYANLC